MKTLNISISEIDYNKFAIEKEALTFSDFVDIISKELTRQTLERCVELGEKFGLSKLTHIAALLNAGVKNMIVLVKKSANRGS